MHHADESKVQCRQVIKTIDGAVVSVFLCTWHCNWHATWHATKCWLEQLRNKMVDKERFTEAFHTILTIMLLKVGGTSEEKLSAVDTAKQKIEEAFSSERSVLQWFEREWELKKGEGPEAHTSAIDCCP
jgi:hypothetical protein